MSFTKPWLLAVLLVPLLTACGEDEPIVEPPPEDPNPAATLFREVFSTGAYGRLREAESALLSRYAEDPTDAENTFLLAGLYMWEIAEWERDPSRGNQAYYAQLMKLDRYMSEAVQLDPSRGIARCFLGVARLFRAQPERNPALATEGQNHLNKCIELHPQFGLLLIPIGYHAQPVASSQYQRGVAEIFNRIDSCIDAKIDRENPDLGPYVDRMNNFQPPYHACWNIDRALYNLEGFWMLAGNMLVKNNRPDVAKILYRNVKYSQLSFDRWVYKDEFLELERTADARAALYQDADRTNDPPVLRGAIQCVQCHEKKPAPQP
ncbi:MAG TPA: hypothetical protein VE153_05200 [Myxococcus sp.]|jgi:hypothetical protein|nr:hypothetical protein [Myxococcus sp.]